MYSKFEEKSEKKATDVFGRVKNCISFTRNRDSRLGGDAENAHGVMLGRDNNCDSYMKIRIAQEKDIDRIHGLLTQVNALHHAGRPDLFKAGARKYTDEELRRIFVDAETPVLVAVDDNDCVAGYAFCMFVRHKDSHILTDICTLYVDDICVDESMRGRHIGTLLYDAVVELARERHCHNVTLNVWCCNESAMSFYEKCGMKPQKVGMEMIL